MDNIKNVCIKLSDARIELQKKEMKKSGKNAFANFAYFELEDMLPIINNVFHELKMIDKLEIENGTAKLTIINAENPTDVISFSIPVVPSTVKGCSEMQNIGASITYARRYLYLAALGISENDTLDAVAGSNKIEENPDLSALRDVNVLNATFHKNKKGLLSKDPRFAKLAETIKLAAKAINAHFDEKLDCFVVA